MGQVGWRRGFPHLLVSFVDMLGYGREVRVELAERFHNRRSVRCVLGYPACCGQKAASSETKGFGTSSRVTLWSRSSTARL